MSYKGVLTPSEKGYIKAHSETRSATVIAKDLTRNPGTILRFISKNNLPGYNLTGRPRNPLSVLKHRAVEYDLYIDGKLFNTFRNSTEYSDYRMINKIREKHADLIFGRKFEIYKRIPCFFPQYKIPKIHS